MRNSLWFIKGIDVLSELNPSMLETVSRTARIDGYPRGQVFSLPNAPAFSVYIVSTGRMKYVRLLPDNTEGLSMDIVRGEVLGWIPTDEERPCPYFLMAVEDIVLWVLSKSDFRRFFIDGTQGIVFRVYAGRLMRKRIENTIWPLMYTDVPVRIASLLLSVDRAKLAPHHVAHLAGTSVEQVVLTLAGFLRRGLIEMKREEVIVRNPAALKAVAGATS